MNDDKIATPTPNNDTVSNYLSESGFEYISDTVKKYMEMPFVGDE